MRRIWASLEFALVSAGQNFRRNLAVSLAGVFTMALILLMVGGTLLGTHTVNRMLDNEQAKASKLRIYLKDGVSLASVMQYEDVLKSDPRVMSVSFENKDDAQKENLAADPTAGGATSVLGFNPLPASLNIETFQLHDLDALDSVAKASPIVDPQQRTDYQPVVVSRLQSAINWIKWIGLGVSFILGFISLVIIMNTIRTAVYVRRTEIEIMKLVGATDWFVRWPFILEGMLGGILAAVASSVIMVFADGIIKRKLGGELLFGGGSDGGYLTLLLFILCAAGIFIGSLGSYLGVRRFLTV